VRTNISPEIKYELTAIKRKSRAVPRKSSTSARPFFTVRGGGEGEDRGEKPRADGNEVHEDRAHAIAVTSRRVSGSD